MDELEISELKDIYIFNPTSEPFTWTYDLSGEGRPDTYTIQAQESGKFPKPAADCGAIHLKDLIVHKRKCIPTDTVVAEIMQDIYL